MTIPREEKVISLGDKVLEFKIVGFEKLSLGSYMEGDLKLFNKFVIKDLRLWNF